MRSTRTGAPTPKKEMWLSVIVYHLLAGMLSLCISVRKTAGICEWVCVHMWRPVVDNVCLSAHSSKTQQNNPPENHLTLHQEYRLPSTARSKASQMSVSWRKRKRERAGEKKENENSCSSSTYAPFLKQNLPARLLQPLPIHWHIRTKTHTLWNAQHITRARKHSAQWSHFSHDPHQLSVSL